MRNAKNRRLLVSKQKDTQKNTKEMVIIIPPNIRPENPTRSPFIPRESPHQPNSPPPPPSSEPIPPPPVSPTIEQTASQESESRSSSTIYASIGASIGFVVVALLAVYFFYYRCRNTSTVVPLTATSSRQLQNTSMEGWFMC